jgi:maltose/maltodextrin transport system substrate-binding protein/arabinogalactan oligomer/maltooligosaccharide transport system substrate-binding protein
MIKRLIPMMIFALFFVSLAACGPAPAIEAPIVETQVDEEESLKVPPLDENCVVTPDGQAFGSRGVSVGSGLVPHGELVFAELQELIIGQLGGVATNNQPTGGVDGIERIEEWETTDEGTIFLVAVDTDAFTTDLVAERIEGAIGYIENGLSLTDRFVLNMSFAIVPCDPTLGLDIEPGDQEDLIDQYVHILSHQDLQEFRKQLEQVAGLRFEEADKLRIVELYPPDIDLNLSTDPLETLANDPLSILLSAIRTDVISVGAAGNFGEYQYDFPFAPAIWDFVVSVSAAEDDAAARHGELASYSNAGEVLMSGQHPTENEVGTSFAAPRFSLEAALYLLRGGSITCNNLAPPLAYVSLDALPPGPWANLALHSEEAKVICPSFPDGAFQPGDGSVAILVVDDFRPIVDTEVVDAEAEEVDVTIESLVPSVSSLTIWADNQRVPALEALGQQFQAQYGVEIIVEEYGFNDIRDNFLVAAMAGEGPDIVIGYHEWLGAFVPNGLLTEIDLGDKEGDFLPAAVQAFNYEGALYGLPYATSNVALFYNPDLVPYVPGTWYELMDMAAKLQASGEAAYGYVLQSGDSYHFFPIQTAFGGYVFGFNADGSYNPYDVGIDSECSLEAAKWLDYMVQNNLLLPDMDWDTTRALFETGEAAMIVTGPWALNRFREAGVNYAIANLPSEVQDSRPFLGVYGFMISAVSKDPQLAEVFLTEFVATEAGMQMIYDATRNRPSAHLAVQTGIEDPDLRALGEAGANGLPLPAIPQMSVVWEPWDNAITLIFQQEMYPDEAFYNAAEQIRVAIDEQ